MSVHAERCVYRCASCGEFEAPHFYLVRANGGSVSCCGKPAAYLRDVPGAKLVRISEATIEQGYRHLEEQFAYLSSEEDDY